MFDSSSFSTASFDVRSWDFGEAAVVQVVSDTHDGDYSVYRVETKRKKKDEDVRVRLLEAYAQAIAEPEIAVRAAEIVMSHQVAVAPAAVPYIPPADVIDWASVAADLKAIEALIVLAIEAERMQLAKLAEIGQQNELLCLDLI